MCNGLNSHGCSLAHAVGDPCVAARHGPHGSVALQQRFHVSNVLIDSPCSCTTSRVRTTEQLKMLMMVQMVTVRKLQQLHDNELSCRCIRYRATCTLSKTWPSPAAQGDHDYESYFTDPNRVTRYRIDRSPIHRNRD